MSNSIPSSPPPSVRSQPAASDEKNRAWQDVLNTAVSRMNSAEIRGSLSHLGDFRIDSVKQKITEEMEAFVRNNPNASPEQIRAEAEKATSKHETNAVLQKMRDDNFFNKLMSRRKELLRDMWG
jgi:hypothetical protein